MFIKIATGADVSGFNKADNALKKVGKTTQQVAKQTSLLGAITKSVLGGATLVAFKGLFSRYLQFEKDLGAMRSRFFAITHDEKLASEEFKYISKVAIDTANDVKAVTDSYSIFYASSRRSLGQEGARGVFEAWTKIGRVLHLDAEAFSRVTYALREMSSKGQLYSQDLKMQLGTHVPDAVNIAQTAIQNLGISGVDTVEKFQELTKKNPKSGLMAKFLIEFSKEAEKRFASPEALAKSLRQPDALAQMIPNMFWQFLTKFSESGGNEAIINILQATFDMLNAVPWNVIANVTGFITKYLSYISNVLKYIAWNVGILLSLRGIVGLFRGAMGLFKGIKVFFSSMKALHVFAAFLPRALYALGIAFPKLAGFFLRGGLKAILGGLLTISGPLGWVFTALTFLPEIVHLCKWIYNKISGKDKTSLGSYLETQGVSPANLYNAMQKAQEFTSPEMSRGFIQNYLANYVGKDVAKTVQYNDNGQLVVNFKGNFLTMEDIQNELNIGLKIDEQTGGKFAYVKKYSEKPSVPIKDFKWKGNLY